MPKFITANIKANPKMAQNKVNHDIQKVRSTNSTIFFWQEISISRYKKALQKIFFNRIWNTIGLSTETPISVDRRHWDILYAGIVCTHGGLAGVSPARYIVWAIVQAKGTNNRFAIINTHTVSGAFTAKKKYNLTRNFRVSRWNYHWAITKVLITRLKMLNYSVIAAGDWNRIQLPNTAGMEHLTPNHSLDHIIGFEADKGYAMQSIGNSAKSGYYTDHAPTESLVKMWRKKGYYVPTGTPKTNDMVTWKTGRSQPQVPKA